MKFPPIPHNPTRPTKPLDRNHPGEWINPVFTAAEAAIPRLQSISSTTSITLSAIDLAKATVLNQVDRKFILISIPHEMGRIIALIDQHAADERFRLERILKTAESVPASLALRLGKSELATLERRKEGLRRWGIDVEIVGGTVRIVRIPKVLAKDIDSVPWREILASYTAGGTDECPPLLMNLFCSKACRSVPPPLQERDLFHCVSVWLWGRRYMRLTRVGGYV
jgi:DNA mismatch repair ATPase MutL